MPAKSRPQIGLVVVIVAVALFQLVSVTVAALPTNKASEAARPVTSYLDPYFTQNWRLFAPNPISDDRSIWFRGEYADEAGKVRQTPWLDWTNVELDLVRHQVVGGRAGYITNKMIGSLNSRFLALDLDQRKIALHDRDTALEGFAALRAKLLAAKDNPALVDLYLRYETSIVRLATAVLAAEHPDVSFTAVRYRIIRQRVVRFDDRNAPEKVRQESRPDPSIRRSGWRKPVQPSAAEGRVVAEFLARHR